MLTRRAAEPWVLCRDSLFGQSEGKNVFLGPFYTTTPNICQDRLGTNIGKSFEFNDPFSLQVSVEVAKGGHLGTMHLNCRVLSILAEWRAVDVC